VLGGFVFRRKTTKGRKGTTPQFFELGNTGFVKDRKGLCRLGKPAEVKSACVQHSTKGGEASLPPLRDVVFSMFVES